MRVALTLTVLITLEAALVSAAPASAAARPGVRLSFVNSSPDSLREIYACPSGSPTWGRNLLGKRTLAPGQRITLLVPGDCGAYDLRLVAGDGKTEYLEEGLELCHASEAGRAAAPAMEAGSDEEDVVTIGGGALTRSKQRSHR